MNHRRTAFNMSRRKLTNEQVLAIAKSNESLSVLSTKYLVSIYCIRGIRCGRTYRDITGIPHETKV